MRRLLSLLLLAVLAVALALAGRYAPGYVVLVFPPWRVELSFVTFLLLLAALLTGTYIFVRLASLTLHLPQAVRDARARQEQARQETQFCDTVAAWLEGRHQEAERLGASLIGPPDKLGLARVIAARAAQSMRAFGRRDAHLLAAKEHAPLASLYFEAETNINEGDLPAALTALKEALVLAPKHSALQTLELKAKLKSGHWEEALKLIEALSRANTLEPAQARQMRLSAVLGVLGQSGLDDQVLLEYWKKLPEADRREPLIARGAAAAFLARGGGSTAARLVENVLDLEWHEDLARFYGTIVTDNLPRQIDKAEAWLKGQPRDAGLLLSLARLCTAASLWGKAQSYLEASLALAPSVEALLALAELEEKSGRSNTACGHLKQALALCRKHESSARIPFFTIPG